MRKKPEIKQVSTKGSQGTQVGIQNINVGMTPQAASEMAINLFLENFPKLQEEARKVAQERADALCREIIDRLEKEGVKEYSAFKEPDVQYVLLESQKKYARFGTTDMLETLSGLICKRIQNDEDFILKVTINKAIEIAPMITPGQLDFLSLLFFCSCATYEVKSLEQFTEVYTQLAEIYKDADFNALLYLNMQGCLVLDPPKLFRAYSEMLKLPEEEIEKACPEIIKQAIKDYSPSYVGIILAIMNAEIKTGEKIEPHIWIR